MTSRDFVYWLNGYFEISEPKEIDAKQTDMIKRHLALVFKHEIDPSMGDDEHQQELNQIHNGNNFTCSLHPTDSNPFPIAGDGDMVFRC